MNFLSYVPAAVKFNYALNNEMIVLNLLHLHGKRNARLKSPPFKCVPPAVEPQYIFQHSSSFTDCESDFTDNSFLTSSEEGGVTDFNDSIDFVVVTDSILIMMLLPILILFLLLRNPGLEPQSYR